MKLKICGMKHPANIKAVGNLNPDYLGFIMYEKSPRFFEGIIPELPDSIRKVGVFVNADIDSLLKSVKYYRFNAIQLHGNESPEYLAKLDALLLEEFGNGVCKPELIKVFSVIDRIEAKTISRYEQYSDFFLFDTKGLLPGGNGFTFNWSALDEYPSETPFFLSGGIGQQEIGQILEFLSSPAAAYCHAIDVNSRFESEPGMKIPEKLKLFKSLLP
ncbi:phosphoribosylanthranilate isomerase [Robertkochia solimangrovi]|uniref:phosphoribosylanthranilate isomerase n=1 Tax=Robertkochia solimangrovi TaxID=2213046 RepID=UPI00117FDCE1|nr:phosphoribosylanthranilate isomerase [Robertkochia solimangrovi]TRZ41469.1 phosphoribosylanthranilate isomerase [Robertkochia solimangrovi]